MLIPIVPVYIAVLNIHILYAAAAACTKELGSAVPVSAVEIVEKVLCIGVLADVSVYPAHGGAIVQTGVVAAVEILFAYLINGKVAPLFLVGVLLLI